MTIKKTIGKNTLGQGEKMNIAMKSYGMTTVDLSKRRRTTMAPGVLTPLYQTIGLPGDKFEISINASVLTLPTNGPLYGSFKYQVDFFKADLRLYQSMMQNNELEQGMDMSEVKLPQFILAAKNTFPDDTLDSNSQTNPSSIFARLGIRGVGHAAEETPEMLRRTFNASSWLAYWDIFKNFYANRQEADCYVIHNTPPDNFLGEIASYILIKANGDAPVAIPLAGGTPASEFIEEGDRIRIVFTGIDVDLNKRPPEYTILNIGDKMYNPMDIWAEKTEFHIGTDSWWELSGVKSGYSELGTLKSFDYVEGTGQVPILTPNLVAFPLKNLDEIRRKILQSNVGITIDQNEIAPYGLALSYSNWLKTAALGTQEGLAVKTYQSDIFNNWIRTEFVENANAVSAVSTAGGSFTMDMLNLAQKLYDMQNRIALSGGSIDDWIETVWTAGRNNNVTTPEYMGGMSREVEFQEVVATAETIGANGATPLGQLGGRGVTHGERRGGNIKIVVGTQPCVILAIASLTPRIGYSQGNDWETNLKTMDDLHKPALDGIGYEDVITDQFDWRDTTIEVPFDAEPVFKSIGKRPAWLNYTTAYDQICGNFAIPENQMFMVLDRRYDYTSAGIKGTKDKTTYIDPAKYNYAFAETTIDAQNFWVQTGFDVKARRKMSARQIPNL